MDKIYFRTRLKEVDLLIDTLEEKLGQIKKVEDEIKPGLYALKGAREELKTCLHKCLETDPDNQVSLADIKFSGGVYGEDTVNNGSLSDS